MLPAIILLGLVCLPADDFALRDGDTVVFLGDSITAARAYGRTIENYTLLRYPDRKVRFWNAGWGGDTAEGGLKRLERDVFSRGATVLTVAYGVNDIGWGTRADAEHKSRYLEAVRGIVEACKARNVRVYICSAAITAENPDTAETGFLQKMCDEGMALSKSLGGHSIDVQRSMREIQRRVNAAAAASKDPKDKPTLHVSDGVHLNDLGQLAMAFAILKGLGAPADVSSVELDAHDRRVIQAENCTITHVLGNTSRLSFDRLDRGLPLNFGPLGALQFRFIPIPESLNRYMLKVQHLDAGKYSLKVDDRALGTYTAESLSQGVNIASATADGWEPGGPWDAQAAILMDLTNARDNLAQSGRMARHWIPNHPSTAPAQSQADALNSQLEALQRTVARPTTCHFELQRLP